MPASKMARRTRMSRVTSGRAIAEKEAARGASVLKMHVRRASATFLFNLLQPTIIQLGTCRGDRDRAQHRLEPHLVQRRGKGRYASAAVGTRHRGGCHRRRRRNIQAEKCPRSLPFAGSWAMRWKSCARAPSQQMQARTQRHGASGCALTAPSTLGQRRRRMRRTELRCNARMHVRTRKP